MHIKWNVVLYYVPCLPYQRHSFSQSFLSLLGNMQGMNYTFKRVSKRVEE